ncbi:MAG: type II toxin-antitoxin system RelE/ParE family toxin [Myxococcota bacterium]
MTLQVETLPLADEHLEEIQAWWFEKRRDVPFMVLDEYARIIALIGERPEIGRPYVRRGVRNVRWVLMHGSEHKVYYHDEPGSDVVSVIAVWGGARKGGPPIVLPK